MAVKRYSGTSWVTEAGAAAPLPSGMLAPFAGAAAPTGWLLCDGGTFSATAYPQLAAVLGNTYGVASGDSYYLPDLRGRTVAGKDNMGGTTASRITTAVSGVTATTLGAVGGSERLHQHSHPNTVSGTFASSGHTHGPGSLLAAIGATNSDAQRIGYVATGVNGPSQATYSNSGVIGGLVTNPSAPFNHYTAIYGATDGPSAAASVSISNVNNAETGTSQNLPPTIVLNYIIKV